MHFDPDAANWLSAHRDLLLRKRGGGVPANPVDEAGVIDLLSAYAVFYDAGDIDALLDLFSPDATYASYLGSYTGHADLRANFAPLVERYDGAAHMVTNTTVLVTSENEAEAVSYLLAQIQTNDGVAYAFTGTYQDRLERTDGLWRFKSRLVLDGLAHTINAIPVENRLPGATHKEDE